MDEDSLAGAAAARVTGAVALFRCSGLCSGRLVLHNILLLLLLLATKVIQKPAVCRALATTTL